MLRFSDLYKSEHHTSLYSEWQCPNERKAQILMKLSVIMHVLYNLEVLYLEIMVMRLVQSLFVRLIR